MRLSRRELLAVTAAGVVLAGPAAAAIPCAPSAGPVLVLHADDPTGAAFAAGLRNRVPAAACAPLTLARAADLQRLRALLAGREIAFLAGLLRDDTAAFVGELAREAGARAWLLGQHVEARGAVRHHFAHVAPGPVARPRGSGDRDWVVALAAGCADAIAAGTGATAAAISVRTASPAGRPGSYQSFLCDLRR